MNINRQLINEGVGAMLKKQKNVRNKLVNKKGVFLAYSKELPKSKEFLF